MKFSICVLLAVTLFAIVPIVLADNDPNQVPAEEDALSPLGCACQKQKCSASCPAPGKSCRSTQDCNRRSEDDDVLNLDEEEDVEGPLGCACKKQKCSASCPAPGKKCRSTQDCRRSEEDDDLWEFDEDVEGPLGCACKKQRCTAGCPTPGKKCRSTQDCRRSDVLYSEHHYYYFDHEDADSVGGPLGCACKKQKCTAGCGLSQGKKCRSTQDCRRNEEVSEDFGTSDAEEENPFEPLGCSCSKKKCTASCENPGKKCDGNQQCKSQ